MPVFWLIVLAAMLCVTTILWVKEALAVAALTERLARRDRDIARLDGLLLLCIEGRSAAAESLRKRELAPEARPCRWVA